MPQQHWLLTVSSKGTPQFTAWQGPLADYVLLYEEPILFAHEITEEDYSQLYDRAMMKWLHTQKAERERPR